MEGWLADRRAQLADRVVDHPALGCRAAGVVEPVLIRRRANRSRERRQPQDCNPIATVTGTSDSEDSPLARVEHRLICHWCDARPTRRATTIAGPKVRIHVNETMHLSVGRIEGAPEWIDPGGVRCWKPVVPPERKRHEIGGLNRRTRP